MLSQSRRQLAMIALVQVLAMALWFSASAVLPAIRDEWALSSQEAALLTAAVQLGFVAGAIVSALLNLADLIRPPLLIAASTVVAAGATGLVAWSVDQPAAAIALRFVTGFALAGVYPVGMRLMATWFDRGRGFALGVLVGALTLGSALPHLINALTSLPWRGVLVAASALALAGAVLAITRLRVGPYAGPIPPLAPGYVVEMFRDRRQRLVNLGYLGHMWELYAMWTWLPAYLAASYAAWHAGSGSRLAVGGTAFLAIGVAGATACVIAGRLADRQGRPQVITAAIATSGLCSVLAGVAFGLHPVLVVPLVMVWGATVIADSAQFSAALTEYADRRYVGTALTAQTALGFLLTVVTIQGLPVAVDALGWRGAMPLLAIGPLAGVAAMVMLRRIEATAELAPTHV